MNQASSEAPSPGSASWASLQPAGAPIQVPRSGLVARLTSIGDRPTDTEEERLKHRLLVLMAVLMSGGGVVWGATLLVSPMPWGAIVPLGYVVLSVCNLLWFRAMKNFVAVRRNQVAISLLLPFLFQWQLGGFENSGAVMLWSLLAMVGALTFSEARTSIVWLAVFSVLAVGSGIFDAELAARSGLVTTSGQRTIFFVFNIVTISAIVFGLTNYMLSQREQASAAQLALLRSNSRLREKVASVTEAVERLRRMGSYQLVEKLGEGGMGEVWRAQHAMLSRPAAVKFIREERLGGKGAGARRFEREALATAALKSQHTIEVYDFGRTEDGAFYYVMELLDGLNLEDLVETYGPLSGGRAAYLLSQACESLADAHTAGLLHRDIKPANIFACRHGRRFDWIKVLDFGLVKTFDADGTSDDTNLTGEHAIVGTPAWIAPEVAGEPDLVDPRSDIYSLGCVAYYLLTGTPVFDVRSPIQAVVKHSTEAVQPPSERLGAPVAPALEALILRCLAKQRADRPATMDLLSEAFRAIAVAEGWTEAHSRGWWEQEGPDSAPTELRGGRNWQAVFVDGGVGDGA